MKAAQVIYQPALADIRPKPATTPPIIIVPKLAVVSNDDAAQQLVIRIISETFVEGYLVIGDFDIIAKIKCLSEVNGFRALEFYYCLSKDGDRYIRAELDENPFILDGRANRYDNESYRPKVQYGPWALTFLHKLQGKFGSKWQYAQIGKAICNANQNIPRPLSLDPCNECLDPKRWIKWDIR